MRESEGGVELEASELRALCESAVLRSGGTAELAAVLAEASLQAEQRGKPVVGALHLLDYLHALRDGQLKGDAEPRIEQRTPAVLLVDADGGAPQLAFERAYPALLRSVNESGVGILSMRNAFTAGELGYYARRAAHDGLVAAVCANSPALMSIFGSKSAVMGTNPLAFAFPVGEEVCCFDQASSSTAWVSVRDAATRGEEIPPGWAIDADGEATTDALEALAGALLPFGGAKGANIALMVEMLAALSGGSFSLEAPPYGRDSAPPSLGMFILLLRPEAFDARYPERVKDHLARLGSQYGVKIGRRREKKGGITISASLFEQLASAQTSTSD